VFFASCGFSSFFCGHEKNHDFRRRNKLRPWFVFGFTALESPLPDFCLLAEKGMGLFLSAGSFSFQPSK
jgi:hypothetical protein